MNEENQKYTSYGDIYTPDSSEKVEEVFCGLCGDKMMVERDVMGATSLAEAWSKKKHMHDFFECPNMAEMWHLQAKAIRHQIRETPSAKLAAMLQEELNEILKTRKATKEVSKFGVF
jgi:hypothetical protein